MTKQPNLKRIACLQLALMPLFGCTVLLFAGRAYAQIPPPTVQTAPKKQVLSITYDSKEVPKVKFTPPGGNLPPGKGATPEQIERFDTIYKNTTVDSKGHKYQYTVEDIKWIKPIYQAMTLEQQREYPTLHFMKPPVRVSPTATQLQEWAGSSKYGIWMDGKRMENQDLANYKTEDIALFNTSRLSKKAINYGKYYVQVDLNSNEWYNKHYTGVTDLMVVIEQTSYTPPPASK